MKGITTIKTKDGEEHHVKEFHAYHWYGGLEYTGIDVNSKQQLRFPSFNVLWVKGSN